MNNFVGYLNEQPQFNLYNFTHWQYIDVLTWFASPVGIPCRPWVEAAHRNGVKIIGTVFTDGPGFVALTQKDAARHLHRGPKWWTWPAITASTAGFSTKSRA